MWGVAIIFSIKKTEWYVFFIEKIIDVRINRIKPYGNGRFSRRIYKFYKK